MSIVVPIMYCGTSLPVTRRTQPLFVFASFFFIWSLGAFVQGLFKSQGASRKAWQGKGAFILGGILWQSPLPCANLLQVGPAGGVHRLCIGGSWGVQGFFMGCSGVVCTRVFRRQVEEVVFMSLTLVGWVRAMRGVSGFLLTYLEVEVQSVM